MRQGFILLLTIGLFSVNTVQAYDSYFDCCEANTGDRQCRTVRVAESLVPDSYWSSYCSSYGSPNDWDGSACQPGSTSVGTAIFFPSYGGPDASGSVTFVVNCDPMGVESYLSYQVTCPLSAATNDAIRNFCGAPNQSARWTTQSQSFGFSWRSNWSFVQYTGDFKLEDCQREVGNQGEYGEHPGLMSFLGLGDLYVGAMAPSYLDVVCGQAQGDPFEVTCCEF